MMNDLASFTLEQETERAPRINESRLARESAWRAILITIPEDSFTTSKLSRVMNMETSAAYRAAKSMERAKLVTMSKPEKKGEPCIITITDAVKYFKKSHDEPTSHP